MHAEAATEDAVLEALRGHAQGGCRGQVEAATLLSVPSSRRSAPAGALRSSRGGPPPGAGSHDACTSCSGSRKRPTRRRSGGWDALREVAERRPQRPFVETQPQRVSHDVVVHAEARLHLAVERMPACSRLSGYASSTSSSSIVTPQRPGRRRRVRRRKEGRRRRDSSRYGVRGRPTRSQRLSTDCGPGRPRSDGGTALRARTSTQRSRSRGALTVMLMNGVPAEDEEPDVHPDPIHAEHLAPRPRPARTLGHGARGKRTGTPAPGCRLPVRATRGRSTFPLVVQGAARSSRMNTEGHQCSRAVASPR
jgi:hypothetical protein